MRANQRAWVSEMMAETIPEMISNQIATEMDVKLTAANDAHAAHVASLQATIDELQAQVDVLNGESERTAARRLRENEHHVQKVLLYWKNSCLRSAFAAWHEALEVSRALMDRAGQFWEKLPLKHAFESWDAAAQEAAYMREVIQRVSNRLRGRVILDVVHEWRAAVVRTVRLRRNVASQGIYMFTSRVRHAYFHAWVLYATRSLDARALNLKISRRINYEMLMHAFEALYVFAIDTAASRQELVRNAAMRLTEQSKVLTFTAWRDYVDGLVAHRLAVYAKSIRRFVSTTLAMVFERWTEWVERKQQILAKAAYYLGPGYLLATMFGKWRAVFKRAREIKQKEWLLRDLKLVGGGWLLETLDAIIPLSLPAGSRMSNAVSQAVGQHSWDISPMSPSPRSGFPPPSADDHADLTSEPASALVPQPPQAARAQPAAPGRAAGFASRPLPPTAEIELHIDQDIALSISIPTAGSGDGDVVELTRGAPSPELEPTSASAFVPLSTIDHAGDGLSALPMARGRSVRRASIGSIDSNAGLLSSSVHALALYLDEQQKRSEVASRHASETMREVGEQQARDSSRLSTELRQLHALQLQQAKVALDEASKRHSEISALDRRVTSLASTMADMESHMEFVKDTLYSVLTTGQGGSLARNPSNKPQQKFLKPIKQSKATPWNASLAEFGLIDAASDR